MAWRPGRTSEDSSSSSPFEFTSHSDNRLGPLRSWTEPAFDEVYPSWSGRSIPDNGISPLSSATHSCDILPASLTTSKSSPKRVHFPEGLPDGVDYLSILKDSNPDAYRSRYQSLFDGIDQQEVESFKRYYEKNGIKYNKKRLEMAHQQATWKTIYKLRNELQTEYGSPFPEPRGYSGIQEHTTEEQERKCDIEDLIQEAESRLTELDDQIHEMQLDITEDRTQSILRGWLDATHGEEISKVVMDGWQNKARPAPRIGRIKVSEEDHAALFELELPKLRSDPELEGLGMSVAELRKLHHEEFSRYHELDLDPKMMDKYPKGVQDSLKRAMSTSEFITDPSEVSAWQRKHLTEMCRIQDASQGKSKDEIDQALRDYVQKHRRDTAYTVTEKDGMTTISFNEVDLDSGEKIIASAGRHTISVQRYPLTRNDTELGDEVDTFVPNPFVARGRDRSIWLGYQSMRRRFEKDKAKKEKALEGRVAETRGSLTVPTRSGQLGIDDPIASVSSSPRSIAASEKPAQSLSASSTDSTSRRSEQTGSMATSSIDS